MTDRVPSAPPLRRSPRLQVESIASSTVFVTSDLEIVDLTTTPSATVEEIDEIDAIYEIFGNETFDCVYCHQSGHFIESCTMYRRLQCQRIYRQRKCNICMCRGHENVDCNHPMLVTLSDQCSDLCNMYHDVTMIRMFLKGLRINELRGLCKNINLPLNLSRKKMIQVMETLLIVTSKQVVINNIIKVIEHGLRECEVSRDTEENLALRRTMLMTKMVNVAAKARENVDKIADMVSHYTVNSYHDLQGYASLIDLFVLNRSSKQVRTEFPEMKAPTNDSECSICFESIAPANQIQTECNHVYCRGCMISYLKNRVDENHLDISCAMCRRELMCIFV